MELYKKTNEVSDIFREHFDQYQQQYGPFPKHHYDVANAIMLCQTEQLGGHVYKCDSCSHEIILYNSCRNRHCPKCQAATRAKWAEKKMDEVLPVSYFHVVFTLPHQLNSIVLRNKKESYSILFKAVSETLITLGKNKKYTNGQIGFFAALHTWGQVLTEHPHIHCIIPAGAFNKHENTWNNCKQDFLFPVAVMQKLFRGKFMDYFTKAVSSGSINPMFVATPEFPSFKDLVNKLYSLKWVVYVKKPFKNVENLVKYQARYINRVAISNNRILDFSNGKVTFSYKDYADKDINKTMTISAVEFIRRFMLHILPSGFMRIRQYGFLSNASKKKSLEIIRTLIFESDGSKQKTREKNNSINNTEKQIQCPLCKKGVMMKSWEITPVKKDFTKAVNH